jgi:hypothetical protein
VIPLIVAGALLAFGLLIVAVALLLERVFAPWWGRRSTRRTIAEERRANQGPPPGMPERRHRDVGPAGRHRRDDTVAGQVTATGILRAVRPGTPPPPIPRATRRQLRDAGTGR